MKKKRFKIISTLFLTAIYCFAMVVVSQTTPSQDNHANTQHAESYFTNLSTNPFCHTTPTKSNVDVSNNLPSGSEKNVQNDLYTLPAKAETRFYRKYHQYKNEGVQFLINYLKATLIFPFHYFW